MVDRRSFVFATCTGIVASTSGCLDVLTGEEPVEFGASPAGVAQPALDETGYQLAGREEVVIEREFEAGGETREVLVTNYQVEYQKSIDMGPLGQQEAAVFTALTTPRVNVLGREFNPVADMSTEELAEMVQEQYDEVRNLERRGDSEVSVHGETTTQGKFLAEGTLAGEAVDLFLHVSEAVEMADDLVVTVGAYPELTPEEEENVLTLMAAVEPGE